jgi:hypothetical protein
VAQAEADGAEATAAPADPEDPEDPEATAEAAAAEPEAEDEATEGADGSVGFGDFGWEFGSFGNHLEVILDHFGSFWIIWPSWKFVLVHRSPIIISPPLGMLAIKYWEKCCSRSPSICSMDI